MNRQSAKGIPFNDLKRRAVCERESLLAAATRVINSGWFVLGPEVKAFETEFASYIGVPHCTGVGNGSDALSLALSALDVRAGDEVATCANAAMYSTLAIQSLQAKPVFVDVLDSHTMSAALFADAVKASAGRLKVVMVTHLYGQVADIEEIVTIARSNGVFVVEDCAQAHGATRHGKRAGAFGDIGTFSFYPTKNLGGLGDGGAVVCRDHRLHERLQSLRQYGWSTKYSVSVTGGRNSRLDEIEAAFLRVRLPMLDECNRRRRAIASRYIAGIRHADVRTPPAAADDYVAHLFVVMANNRDALREHLSRHGITTEIHYPICDHKQPAMVSMQQTVALPMSERLSSEVLSLPCFPELTDSEVDAVIATVNAWQSR